MLTIRNAKPLFALTVLLAPWDILLFASEGGWGFTFVFGRFVVLPIGIEFLDPAALFTAYSSLGQSGQVGLLGTAIWIVCGTLAAAGALFTVYGRLTKGGTTRGEDRQVGIAFIATGGVFLLTRSTISLMDLLAWTSVPLGAVYVIFVGSVFYYDLFRFQAG